MESKEQYRRWSTFTLVLGIAATVTLIVALIAWAHLAGQAGSPQPENWALKSRILDIIERSLLPLLAICIGAPFAWGTSTQGKAWGIYAVPVVLAIALALFFLL